MADNDNNNNTNNSSKDIFVKTGKVIHKEKGRARVFDRTPTKLSPKSSKAKWDNAVAKRFQQLKPDIERKREAFLQAAAAAKTAKENEILQKVADEAAKVPTSGSSNVGKYGTRGATKKRAASQSPPDDSLPPPEADQPVPKAKTKSSKKKSKADSPPLFTDKNRQPENLRIGFEWVWNEQRGCWEEVPVQQESDPDLPPNKEVDSDGNQSIQYQWDDDEEDDVGDKENNNDYHSRSEPEVAQAPSAVHFLHDGTLDLADPSILTNHSLTRTAMEELVAGKHMPVVLEFGPNANPNKVYEAYEISVVYIVVYTAETGSVLIEKVADTQNETDEDGNNKYPMFAMIHPEDFPQGVYVLTNAGARFLDEEVKQAILAAGHSLNMENPNTPFKSPPNNTNQTSIRSESNPPYQPLSNQNAFANPKMQELLRAGVSSAHSKTLQKLNWLTAALNRDHDHVNMITDGTLQCSTLQDVHSYVISCESYNDRFKEWGIIKCVYALPLLYQGQFAPSITFLDGKPSRLTLDFFGPVKASANATQADPSFEYVTTQPLAIRNINNLLQFIFQLFRLKDCTDQTTVKFWKEFLNGLSNGINWTGKFCIDGLLGKQVNELVNTAIADIFDAINRNAIAGSIGAAKPPMNMAELLVTVQRIGAEATSPAKFKEYHMMRGHDMISKPDLTKLTVAGKSVKLTNEPYYRPTNNQRESGYFQSTQRDANGNYYRYPHNRGSSTLTRTNTVPHNIERSVAINRPPRDSTIGGGQSNRNTQPINRTPPNADSVCLSHLATGLKIPGAIACKRPLDCKMHHVAIPDTGGKFTHAAKSKILSTVESRYPGTTPFKTQLLEAVSQL